MLAVVAAVGCRGDRAPAHDLRDPHDPAELAAELRALAAADPASRRDGVASWLLDRDAWQRVVIEPYRALWPEYERDFATAASPLVARLGAAAEIRARRHFAGDPQLAASEARLRWALPPLAPSVVAQVDGAPLGAVFVHDGAGWRALVGVDELVLARVRGRDAACADDLARAGPSGHCSEVGWMIADAALRSDADRFAHACQLAATLCGNASP